MLASCCAGGRSAASAVARVCYRDALAPPSRAAADLTARSAFRMPIDRWSDHIAIVELGDEPQFSDDLTALSRLLDDEQGLEPSVVLDFSRVTYLNSSNMAAMLKVRKRLMTSHRQLRICAVNDPVWGLFMTAGFDKLFVFVPDIATALASIQMKA
jgi:anti-anti-sigma factor